MKYPCEYLDITSPQIIPVVTEKIGKRYEWHSTEPGTFRLSSAKWVNFYSTLVWKNGGYLSLYDGTGRMIAAWPSLFTGSFVLQGAAQGGLYARVGAAVGMGPGNTICWMESDA